MHQTTSEKENKLVSVLLALAFGSFLLGQYIVEVSGAGTAKQASWAFYLLLLWNSGKSTGPKTQKTPSFFWLPEKINKIANTKVS